MSTSPDDRPRGTGPCPARRARDAAPRPGLARGREVVEAPRRRGAPSSRDAVVADDTQTAPERPAPTGATDGNGAGRAPPVRASAATSARQETKVATAPAADAAVLERRFRQTVTKVDLWSVTKIALCFYITAMVVIVVALVALWTIADSAGIIESVEKFIGDLLDSKDFHFLSAEVLRGAVLVGARASSRCRS